MVQLRFWHFRPHAAVALVLLFLTTQSAKLTAQLSNADTGNTSVAIARFTEIARKIKQSGSSRVTLIKVAPPTLPAAPRPPAPPELTAAERIALERRAKKTYDTLTVTATVYVGPGKTISELTWTIEEKTYRAFSNADFRLLTQVLDIETESSVYFWFPFVAAVDGEPDRLLHQTALTTLARSGENVDYVLEGGDTEAKANAKTFDALDYLHAYYHVNRAALLVAWKLREAEAEENERKRATQPPASPVLRLWSTPAKKP